MSDPSPLHTGAAEGARERRPVRIAPAASLCVACLCALAGPVGAQEARRAKMPEPLIGETITDIDGYEAGELEVDLGRVAPRPRSGRAGAWRGAGGARAGGRFGMRRRGGRRRLGTPHAALAGAAARRRREDPRHAGAARPRAAAAPRPRKPRAAARFSAPRHGGDRPRVRRRWLAPAGMTARWQSRAATRLPASHSPTEQRANARLPPRRARPWRR